MSMFDAFRVPGETPVKPISVYPFPVMDTTRIWITPLTAQSSQLMRVWRNEVRERFFDMREITVEEQEQWFERYIRDPTDLCWIVRLTNYNAVGTIALTHVADGRAEIGRLIIIPEFQGRGYAKLAEQAAVHYGFSVLKLKTIYTYVREDNIAPFKAAESAGLKEVRRENGRIYMEVHHG